MEIKQPITFSIIIPTRDRPDLFKLALDSVLAQDYSDIEILVVNDGSSGDFLNAYQVMEKDYSNKVTFYYLTYRPNGHGQSYSMNYGASFATGDYLCFLDDDDFWTDTGHLTRAANSIRKANSLVDLYFTNQKAFFSDGTQQQSNVWIEDLPDVIRDQKKDDDGSYALTVLTLLKSRGFAHFNCSIYRKGLYEKIKGMDEHIRYECDRDIYIRALDNAELILYNPAFVSRHHIPDSKKSNNMSTAISIFEKKLFQLRVYDKGILLSQKPEIINFCKIGKGYELKRITETLVNNKQYDLAKYYGREALGVMPGFKWGLYMITLFLRSVIGR